MGKRRDYLFTALFLLALWETASILLDSMALPDPVLVLTAFWGEMRRGTVWYDFYISSLRAVLGILLALSFAVPVGLVAGAEEGVRRKVSPLIYLLYPIPHVVLLPLIIILFGIGNFSKIFLIALIVFFQILVTTRDAAKNIHRNYFYSLRSLGATKRHIYRHVVFPATLPKILTAMRISIGTAIAILFFAESFATTEGLGYIIMDSWGRSDYVRLYSGILGMALLGFVLYIILDRIEKRVCRWTYL